MDREPSPGSPGASGSQGPRWPLRQAPGVTTADPDIPALPHTVGGCSASSS